MDKAE